VTSASFLSDQIGYFFAVTPSELFASTEKVDSPVLALVMDRKVQQRSGGVGIRDSYSRFIRLHIPISEAGQPPVALRSGNLLESRAIKAFSADSPLHSNVHENWCVEPALLLGCVNPPHQLAR